MPLRHYRCCFWSCVVSATVLVPTQTLAMSLSRNTTTDGIKSDPKNTAHENQRKNHRRNTDRHGWTTIGTTSLMNISLKGFATPDVEAIHRIFVGRHNKQMTTRGERTAQTRGDSHLDGKPCFGLMELKRLRSTMNQRSAVCSMFCILSELRKCMCEIVKTHNYVYDGHLSFVCLTKSVCRPDWRILHSGVTENKFM